MLLTTPPLTGLRTTSSYDFTRAAIPREIIARFEPCQTVKSLLSLSQGLSGSNSYGITVACIPVNLISGRLQVVPLAQILGTVRPKALMANQGKSHLRERFSVWCRLPAPTGHPWSSKIQVWVI